MTPTPGGTINGRLRGKGMLAKSPEGVHTNDPESWGPGLQESWKLGHGLVGMWVTMADGACGRVSSTDVSG